MDGDIGYYPLEVSKYNLYLYAYCKTPNLRDKLFCTYPGDSRVG